MTDTSPANADEKRFKRLESLSRLLDSAFVIPGTQYRIGVDGLIGLIPGAGDMITAFIGGYIIYESHKLTRNKWLTMQMLGNTGIDLLVGAIPVLGDFFDFAFKSNMRNMKLLRKAIAQQKNPRP